MHVKLKKKFGQNFLIDKNIVRKISSLIDNKINNIIEIGPGIGHLTDELILKNLKKIYLIEIDKDLIPVLQEKYKLKKEIFIINQDILEHDLNVYSNDFTIISNLPYNISSQVLVKINNYNKFDKMVLMFQKEFADRLVATKLNNLNCLINSFYSIKKEFNISKNSFKPIPKVDSTILTFRKRHVPLINFTDIELFTKFKGIIFSNKRKKISTILKKNKIEFNSFKMSDYRAEEYKLDEFIKLFNTLKPELIDKISKI